MERKYFCRRQRRLVEIDKMSAATDERRGGCFYLAESFRHSSAARERAIECLENNGCNEKSKGGRREGPREKKEGGKMENALLKIATKDERNSTHAETFTAFRRL